MTITMVVSSVSLHDILKLSWGHSGANEGALVVCSYKVQLIHRFKAPEELRSSESMPSRSKSLTPNACAADGVSNQAKNEYAR